MKKLLVVVSLLLGSCSGMGQHNDTAMGIGTYLLGETLAGRIAGLDNISQPNIVRIGDELKEKLKELSPKLSGKCEISIDLYHSDQEATHVIFIVCDNIRKIGLRLKYDIKYSAFHILGYWTSGL